VIKIAQGRAEFAMGYQKEKNVFKIAFLTFTKMF